MYTLLRDKSLVSIVGVACPGIWQNMLKPRFFFHFWRNEETLDDTQFLGGLVRVDRLDSPL